MADPFSSCERWLQDALSAFKKSAPATSQKGQEIQELQRQLLNATYTGQQAHCHRLIEDYQNQHPQCSPSLLTIVLPVVYQIEQDWREDRKDFNATLFAFWNLQQVLQQQIERQPITPANTDMNPQMSHMLIAPAPNCAHNLGVYAVTDFFRRLGWSPHMLSEGARPLILSRIRQRHYDFLALSVGHDAGLDGLVDFIHECRTSSANTALRILVGGNIFTLPQSAYAWMGADHIAADLKDAYAYCRVSGSAKPH